MKKAGILSSKVKDGIHFRASRAPQNHLILRPNRRSPSSSPQRSLSETQRSLLRIPPHRVLLSPGNQAGSTSEDPPGGDRLAYVVLYVILKSMKNKILTVIVLCALLTGCAQSMKQRTNTINAINGTLTPISYNKTFVTKTFGPPDSKTASSVDGILKETWTYKANLDSKDFSLNMRRRNIGYLKITMSNDIVTDVDIE